MKNQQEFEEQLNGVLDDAAVKREDGSEELALMLERIVLEAAVDRWNWELADDTGVRRRNIDWRKTRMGHLLS